MTHCQFPILGWQNTASLSYPTHPQPPVPYQVRPSFPTVPTPFGMPPLPNRDSNPYAGVNLSYGFAPNITPCHIPNVQRQGSYPQAYTPQAIGWNVGDKIDGGCASRPEANDSPVENKQVEVVCRAIIVPDEDMPVYSFGDSSVSWLMTTIFIHISKIS